ncbi:MAG: ABC transporter permease [Tannerella sp.]|jgi:ABC-2 type transport system permease protein|nr:ABC transporter permease [Tannerella sp.]
MKTGIIIKREYLRRVNKKSFILMTFLTPLIFAALVFVPLWLSTLKTDNVYTIIVNDRTGLYENLFENTDNYRFVKPNDSGTDAVKGNSVMLEITANLLDNPKALSLYSDKQIPPELTKSINTILIAHLEKQKRASYNIPDLDRIIQDSKVKINVQTIKLDKDGSSRKSSAEIASVIGIVFTFLIYIFIMAYGAMVMQGVMEEKTNRIVEVMISSVRPFDLMAGKIIGIGLVGLTQMILWGILTSGLVSIGGMIIGSSQIVSPSLPVGGMPGAVATPTPDGLLGFMAAFGSFNFGEIFICFILFFVGGYIMYASFYAAIGAAIDNTEDSQQFMMPVMTFMLFAIYAGIYSVQNPDGPLAFWCSFFPFTAPIVMMVRIPFDIPLWQILVSMVLLAGTAVFMVWISAKIYRTGILMYGKKPTFKEIARWVRY